MVGDGKRFLLPSSLSKQGWAEGPKLGLCCPLVLELVPGPQLLPRPPHADGHVCARAHVCMGAPARHWRVAAKN